jgi:hypothetical protein
LKYPFKFSLAKSLGPELFGVFFAGFYFFQNSEKGITRMIFEPASMILFAAILIFLGWSLLGEALAFAISTVTGSLLAFYYLNKFFPAIADRRNPYGVGSVKI